MLAETNQGYINSGVPLAVTRFCIERATISDIADTWDFLSAFKNMKGSKSALRNTADAAVLLCENFNSCGVAFLNVISSKNTVSIATKSCALGYYSFGHEIGHNIGLHHNKEVVTNNVYPYGHGHLIQKGAAVRGARTILAYTASGHSRRINYYSNPANIYSVTGTAMGVQGEANNAAVLLENRFAMQAVGDESGTCHESGTNPVTPKPCKEKFTKNKWLTGKVVKTKTEINSLEDCWLECQALVKCKFINYVDINTGRVVLEERAKGKKPAKKPSKKPNKKPGKKPSKKPGKKPAKKPAKKPGKKPGKKPSGGSSKPAGTCYLLSKKGKVQKKVGVFSGRGC